MYIALLRSERLLEVVEGGAASAHELRVPLARLHHRAHRHGGHGLRLPHLTGLCSYIKR